MTAVEAIALLATLPATTPVCFSAHNSILEVTQIEFVSVTVEGDGYAVTDDGARDDATRVAVVS